VAGKKNARKNNYYVFNCSKYMSENILCKAILKREENK